MSSCLLSCLSGELWPPVLFKPPAPVLFLPQTDCVTRRSLTPDPPSVARQLVLVRRLLDTQREEGGDLMAVKLVNKVRRWQVVGGDW